jgi:hypothetical protein
MVALKVGAVPGARRDQAHLCVGQCIAQVSVGLLKFDDFALQTIGLCAQCG